jgi:hypothetical protein
MCFLIFESLFWDAAQAASGIGRGGLSSDEPGRWCWGPKGFREELLELIAEKQGRQHHGEELRESDERKAERLVAEKPRKLGWTEKELKERRKAYQRKARLAAQLRKDTIMSWDWITRRLAMGHWRTAANAARAHTAK